MSSWPSYSSHFAFFVLISIPFSSSFDSYTTCSNTFNCGGITKVGFPFWGDGRPDNCGYPELKLACSNDVTTIEIMRVKYRLLKINQDEQTLKVVRDDYYDKICSPKFGDTTLDSNLFDYVSGSSDFTLLYDCASSSLAEGFKCPDDETYANVAAVPTAVPGTPICKSKVVVRISDPIGFGIFSILNVTALEAAVKEGFEVKYKVDSGKCDECVGSKGVCGYDWNLSETVCHCPNQTSEPRTCSAARTVAINNPAAVPLPPAKGKKLGIPIGLAVGGAILFGILVGFYFYYFIQRKKRKLAAETQSKEQPTPLTSSSIATPSTNLSQSQSIPSYPSFTSKSDYDNKASTYFGVKVFSYTELEEATENFNPAKELGDGGFGTVYYGKLQDGRVVAVKRLYENNFKRVEQFMNEVEILTRLEHRNLVKLYGCTSKRSRELLLVYEYIPNGTVADHLHGKRVESGFLSWPVRLNIAIETADALAYLHRNDVIHRDVKSNNILLEDDFCVKVADFGLSRLFPNDATHVSTAPQGTPGYVDPEYYQCYQLTDKSDVYSFGVVLIELLSSLQAVDTNRHRLDINLANLAVNKIQNHLVNELVDPLLGFETNVSVRRMTTAVAELAFRCLQQEKDMRPTMDEVLKGLKAVQNEDLGSENGEAVVLDIGADEVGLLKSMPPPLSPDSNGTDKLVFKRWDNTI
ncbi:LEAF RUST 10 DISEASE-RESISTANCE LOCUS RECEPTOR-LIKE PROTEIN KINASE-like 1.3 isoform X2 [Pyrus x bretschneideri]|uniref:LEAF RUST 10 DISEASE-RESISTANCE LOCUS RECEPTOR-LIKE PROTEIN KINASE-like 1.3 isoform X2 n=1 Tax=Pyrus x bretschneideri TaxID=225117 RepID=UPI00202DE6A6|nr:LEAF RUST 10 DISEASE-RESISTANCE LOCUS RECEPTOR-LIKE PROTEIN KINASE-like 1.3 isoform X2 [Pyrus x bretschneideri]